jgi:hypothetical protein
MTDYQQDSNAPHNAAAASCAAAGGLREGAAGRLGRLEAVVSCAAACCWMISLSSGVCVVGDITNQPTNQQLINTAVALYVLACSIPSRKHACKKYGNLWTKLTLIFKIIRVLRFCSCPRAEFVFGSKTGMQENNHSTCSFARYRFFV